MADAEANRRRMVRDLQQQIDTLLDRAERGSLETLSPDDDALVFSRALRLLTEAATGDASALQRLATVDGRVNASAGEGQAASAHTGVELAALQKRVADLETHVDELTDVARARGIQIAGLQRELDAYHPLGTPDEVQAALGRWRSIAQGLLHLLVDSEQTCAQYEVVLGPILLQLDRRSSNLSAILHSLTGVGPPPLRPARGLLASLADLGSDPDGVAIDLKGAVEALQRESSREGDPNDDVVGVSRGSLAIVASDEFQSLLQSTSRVADSPGSLLSLLGVQPPSALYESLRSAGRVAALRIFESSSADRPPHETASLGSLAADPPEEHSQPAGSESDDFDAELTPSRPTKRRRLRQGGCVVKRRRPSATSDADGEGAAGGATAHQGEVIVLCDSSPGEAFDESVTEMGSSEDEHVVPVVTLATSSRKKHNILMPTTQAKLVKARGVELRRFRSNDEAHGRNPPWPQSEPRRRDTPSTVAQLACFPWQLGLFRDEVLAPKTSEYPKFVDTTTHRYPTVDEIEHLYATQPWKRILDRLEPTFFDDEDPHFSMVFRNA
ncbi:hypothetical protein ATCC90586_011665 [Pythium insidiosum]|nr:hypothetical protein ATCC90586_011665 [Pythium insidiosum]